MLSLLVFRVCVLLLGVFVLLLGWRKVLFLDPKSSSFHLLLKVKSLVSRDKGCFTLIECFVGVVDA